jgi:hypothetical protein
MPRVFPDVSQVIDLAECNATNRSQIWEWRDQGDGYGGYVRTLHYCDACRSAIVTIVAMTHACETEGSGDCTHVLFETEGSEDRTHVFFGEPSCLRMYYLVNHRACASYGAGAARFEFQRCRSVDGPVSWLCDGQHSPLRGAAPSFFRQPFVKISLYFPSPQWRCLTTSFLCSFGCAHQAN